MSLRLARGLSIPESHICDTVSCPFCPWLSSIPVTLIAPREGILSAIASFRQFSPVTIQRFSFPRPRTETGLCCSYCFPRERCCPITR
jgi:hypothetical protein